jgi:hypothetical protein
MRGDVALGAETKRPPLDAALQFSYLNLIEFPSRNGTFNQFGRLESKRKEEKERVCSGKERQAAECFFPAARGGKIRWRSFCRSQAVAYVCFFAVLIR